jgi:hypothetical protein
MNSILCNNCYMKILKNITRLPVELRRIIFNFIPAIKVVNMNHYYYNKYHYAISTNIEQREYARYVHDLIRNDNSVAFQQILKEVRSIYENEFTERKRYVYKRKIFKTLYDYLLFLCKNYESNNCKNLLIDQQELKLKLT